MPGFFGVFGRDLDSISVIQVSDCLNPTLKLPPTIWQWNHGLVVDGTRRGARYVSPKGDWLGWFCGEVPGNQRMPWEKIIASMMEGDHSPFSLLNGWFAMLIVHKPSGLVWAISDRRAQQPLFSFVSAGRLFISTAVSSFCRLPDPPGFDQHWLYESIYFNHPVLDRTFLAGVRRVPPATILAWYPGKNSFSTRLWAQPFSRPAEFVRGKEAEDLERHVFTQVASEYFDDDAHTAVALTAGFDARAALASAPRRSDLLAYTYGLGGSVDMDQGAKVAADLGVRHLAIDLGKEFVTRLRDHMIDVVLYSDAIERAVRAELLEVFPTLAGIDRSIVLGGVSGDHLFRDHIRGTGNVPHLISAPMMGYIQGHGDGFEDEGFRDLYGEVYEEFRDYIRGCLEQLNTRHGDLRRAEGYQRYLVYESAPKYFGGEAALAENYLRYRTIYWDPRLVELSFLSERGTLGLSERLPGKDHFREAVMQAKIILQGPHYGGGRIKGVRASTWALGNFPMYFLENTLARAGRYIANGFRRPAAPELVPWSTWLTDPLRTFCEELFGIDARLRSYLNGRFLDSFVPAQDVRLAGRLITAELVLRFIENGWSLE
jgi:hypothetical protein